MAQELDDGEFWLPSEFLTDDDLLLDFKADYLKTKRSDDLCPVFGNSSGANSDLSSPVESVMGSTEAESDEDDFISGLARQMAHSTINESNFVKELQLSGSPQSTLCGFKPDSNQSSPNSASRVSSPPESKGAMGWDLLYAAAGEVARMRMTEQTTSFRNTELFVPPPNPTKSNPVKKPNPPSTYYSTHIQTETHVPFLQTHYQRAQQQQMMEGRAWGQGKLDHGEIGRTQGLSMAAWPTLQQSRQEQQQSTGSGMRAVFLGETKKERTGTGVFLPRRVGTYPSENRKKTGRPTVLLPERVVHALNLNLDSQLHPRYDAGLNQRNNAVFSQKKRSQIPQPATNYELRLPQEWTY